jgi:protein SCO1/2
VSGIREGAPAGAGRRIPAGVVLAAALMLFAAAALWAIGSGLARRGAAASPLRGAGGDLPVLGQVPDFTLVASDGRPFGRSDLDGKPWVVDFIFTTCAGVCPRLSARMASLQDEIPPGARLVSITVDPATDTPEVLRAYAGRYGARPDRWVFLTGDAGAIYRLSADGFRLAAGESPAWDPAVDDGPFFHSSRIVLVDAAGRIRGYYDGDDPGEMRRLQESLRSPSLRESGPS